jgi:hypothetical protein
MMHAPMMSSNPSGSSRMPAPVKRK